MSNLGSGTFVNVGEDEWLACGAEVMEESGWTVW